MLSEVKTTVAIFGCFAATVGLLCFYYSFTLDKDLEHGLQSDVSKAEGSPLRSTPLTPLAQRPSPFYFQVGAMFLILEGVMLIVAAGILFKSTVLSIGTTDAEAFCEEKDAKNDAESDREEQQKPMKVKMAPVHDDETSLQISEARQKVSTTTASLAAMIGTIAGILMTIYSMNTPEPWYSMKSTQVAMFSGILALALNGPSAALALGTAIWEICDFVLVFIGVRQNHGDFAMRKMSMQTRRGS